MANFVYRPRDPTVLDKHASQQGGEFQGIVLDQYKVYSPKKGENCIRILPPTWEGAEYYGMNVFVHYRVGPDRASVLCINKHGRQRCPICDELAAAERAGDKSLDEMNDRKRLLIWLIDRSDERSGPQVWPMPWTVDRDIVKVSKNRQTGAYYSVDDPYNGFDVVFDKEGEGIATKYTGVQLMRDPTTVAAVFLDYIQQHPLPDTLLWRDYNEINNLYTGGGAIPDDVEPQYQNRGSPTAQQSPVQSRRPPLDDNRAGGWQAPQGQRTQTPPQGQRGPTPQSRSAPPQNNDSGWQAPQGYEQNNYNQPNGGYAPDNGWTDPNAPPQEDWVPDEAPAPEYGAPNNQPYDEQYTEQPAPMSRAPRPTPRPAPQQQRPVPQQQRPAPQQQRPAPQQQYRNEPPPSGNVSGADRAAQLRANYSPRR